jgi:hypothetical protein
MQEVAGPNVYGYADQNPIGGLDPSGLDCVSANGVTTCHYFGGPEFSVPTPEGFPTFLGPDSWSNILRYHSYDVSRSIGCADSEEVMQELINNPTPGTPLPATSSGQVNDAIVLGVNNWVISYLTHDLNTGAPLVVNITEGGSALSPGYVVRTVSNGVAHTYGEGLDWQQQPWWNWFGDVGDILNWYVWGRQMDRLISQAQTQCNCK